MLAACVLALGDVLDRDQQPSEALLVAGQHPAGDLDVDPPAGEAVVDGVAEELRSPVPQRDQLLGMPVEHVVAEDLAEVADELVEIGRLEQRQRAPVDLEHADAFGTRLDPGRIGAEMAREIGDAFGAPGVEELPDGAVVLEPQRHRREIEHLGVVVALGQHGS